MYFLRVFISFSLLSKDKIKSECHCSTKDILLDYRRTGVTNVWQAPMGCLKWNIQYSVDILLPSRDPHADLDVLSATLLAALKDTSNPYKRKLQQYLSS